MRNVSILAYFEGGPLDGELRAMPDARIEWRFPYRGRLLGLYADIAGPPAMPQELIYRQERRRTVYAPTGEPVFRFVLANPEVLAE